MVEYEEQQIGYSDAWQEPESNDVYGYNRQQTVQKEDFSAKQLPKR
jgi:hypothetical protein